MTRRRIFKSLAGLFVAKKLPLPVQSLEDTSTGDVVINEHTLIFAAKDGARSIYFNPREDWREYRSVHPKGGDPT